MTELRTDRLVLRRWRDADLDPFAAMCADPLVMEHFPSLCDREQTRTMIDRIRDHFAREGFGLWAVEVPGVAPFIGFTGLQCVSYLPAPEIGWRLAPAHWGRGYATEAARAALAFGFDTLGMPEIVAMVRPANLRSQQVMDRLGMARDASADFDHGSPPRLHWLYRISAA